MNPLFIAPLITGAVDSVSALLQHHWADNAMQRRVEDMRKAGLNPLWMGGVGSGAMVPELPSIGSDMVGSFNSAMQAAQLPNVIEEQKARAAAARASAQLSTIRGSQIQSMTPLEMENLVVSIQRGEVQTDQLREMFPALLNEVRARALASSSSAARTDVLAQLDRLAVTGAANQQQLEKDLGEYGPLGKLFLEVIRSLPLKAR